MDLSKFSTADLQALKANDMTKMSTDGLHMLKGYASQHESAQPAPPEEQGLGSGDLHSTNPISALIGLLGGSTNAFGQKAENAMVGGYLPQVAGAASAATGGDYLTARDKKAAELDSFQKNNGASSVVGEIAGNLALGGATAGMMPKAAPTIMGRLGQAAKTGAVIGGVMNPGDTAGQVDMSGQLPARAWNAAKGGALGLGLGTVAESPNIVKSGLNAAQDMATSQLGKNVEFTPIENQQAVKDAAQKIGIKDLPRAVLTDNPTFQKLESGLSQSGSYPAKAARDQYSKLFKGLDDAASKIDALKTTDSDFNIGGKIQNDLAAQVKKNVAPVAEMYNDLNPVLRKIEVDKPTVNAQFGALRRNPIFQTEAGKAMLADQQNAVLSQPELASLKEFRSTLHDSIGNNSTPLDQKRIDAIYDAVTKIRDNSINATKNTLPKDLHGEVDSFINQHALADAAHSSNLEDINSIKSLVGNKDFKSPSAFLNKLGDMKESDLAQKAANLDVGTWRNLQDKFPSVFEKAKTAKINDMVQRSTNAVKGFNDTQFLKQWDGMDQEMKDILFEPKMQEHIDALKTVKQAIPDKLGPSGTPEGKMIMDAFNPKRTALDYGVKKALDSAAGAKGAAAAVPASTPGGARLATLEASLDRGQTRPAYTGSSRPTLDSAKPKTADSEPKKGEEKWARDGIDKLKEHAGDEKIDALKDQALADPKGRKLLIAASDLKSGSKAMQDVAERLVALYGNAPSKR